MILQLAGLLPIHLQLQQLQKNSTIRMLSLSKTHPLCFLLAGDHRGRAEVSPHAVENMRKPIEKGFLHTSLINIAEELDNVDKRLSLLDKEARPGYRMVDLFEGHTTSLGSVCLMINGHCTSENYLL